MKHLIYTLSVVWLLSFNVSGESSHHYCGSNPFDTEITRVEVGDSGCVKYEMKVSVKDTVKYDLSHYTIAMSCGRIKSGSNSENWKQELGYDRTTGLYGMKVEVPGFGKGTLKSFTVTVITCPGNGGKCYDSRKCCYPIVAYKAAKCVYYQKLKESCSPSPPSEQVLDAHLEKDDTSCFGISDGSLTAIIDEGTAPYSYTWSNGDTTSTINGLPSGIYEVVITDGSGAEITLVETVNQPDQILISGVVLSASCNGKNNGSIDITTSGGVEPFTYQWSNGATTEDVSSLGAGIYTLRVIDSMQCSAQVSFEVKNISEMALQGNTTMPSCNQDDGSIRLVVSGGTPPYSYSWSTGATTSDVFNLSPGNYSVVVADAEGCSIESSYNLKENNTLKLTATITPTGCNDDSTGAIDLLVEGGSEPYTYSWSNGSTTEDISGLAAGNYTVAVTDLYGCTAMLRLSVSKKTFQVSNQIVQPTCDGQPGSVSLLPVNGVPPYTYQWSTGETSDSVNGLEPGVYTVVITDASGCSRQLTYVMMEPGSISVATQISNDQCGAEGSFNIDVTVSGGQAPYTYEWSNGSSDEDQEGLNAGTYSIAIKDAGGCEVTKEIIIPEGQPGLNCSIDAPPSEIQCGSSGNTLSTSVNADSYHWSLQSADNGWVITSDSTATSITYSSGSVNSTATAMLTIVKEGCSQTCTLELSGCRGDGSEEPDPGEDDDVCEDCFESSVEIVDSYGSCRTYEVAVSANDCKYDLSHLNISIPCGKVKDHYNSGKWKMEVGKDPTTGITGLKVDDIQNFNHGDNFKVKFTICSESECETSAENWQPVIGYKAGPCVTYDTLQFDGDDSNGGHHNPVCKAYPNPFKDRITFKWKAEHEDDVSLDLFDYQGHHVRKLFRGKVRKGVEYEVDCLDLVGSLYIYRFRTSRGSTHGKVCKSR